MPPLRLPLFLRRHLPCRLYAIFIDIFIRHAIRLRHAAMMPPLILLLSLADAAMFRHFAAAAAAITLLLMLQFCHAIILPAFCAAECLSPLFRHADADYAATSLSRFLPCRYAMLIFTHAAPYASAFITPCCYAAVVLHDMLDADFHDDAPRRYYDICLMRAMPF